MTVKIGTIRVERNRAIQGAKDMRKTNRELTKSVKELETALASEKRKTLELQRSYDERGLQIERLEIRNEREGQAIPTDLSKRLRAFANGSFKGAHDQERLLLSAADEIERYYGGMLNWKRAAEAKDAALARAAAPAPEATQHAPAPMIGDERSAFDELRAMSPPALYDAEYFFVHGIQHEKGKHLPVAPEAASEAKGLELADDHPLSRHLRNLGIAPATNNETASEGGYPGRCFVVDDRATPATNEGEA